MKLLPIAKVWVLLMSVYTAPADAVDCKGPWTHMLTMQMNDPFESFASKQECEDAGLALKKKFHDDGILAPHIFTCIEIDKKIS